MRKQNLKKAIVMTGLVAVMAASMVGCGKDEETTTAAATEVTTEATIEEVTDEATEDVDVFVEDGEENGDILDYKSEDGWAVIYKPSIFEVHSEDSLVSFVYTGDRGTGSIGIQYVPDMGPEEVLGAINDSWDVEDPMDIERTEGYLPGTEDKWGYWREYGNDCAIAGEYNGGTILFEIHAEGNDEDGSMVISDAISEILNSIEYEKFEAQEMYDFIPGTYVRKTTEEIEGTETEVEQSVTLNEDHTGKIVMQDEVNIIWTSYQLLYEDGTTAFEYDIEGDIILLHMGEGDDWVEFEKQK